MEDKGKGYTEQIKKKLINNKNLQNKLIKKQVLFTSDIFGAKIFIFKQNFQGFILNKRKNLCILFSLILAFFFVGCSDFYQDMAGSSIEMSFKVPEKIDERGVVSRSTSITNIVTYKLVVKLESKNEVLDKIEKKVCSGELVNLAFTNVKKDKTVKVSAQLFQEEECVYIGESDWINTTKGKNYAKVVLEKGELDSISAEYIGGYELYGVEVQKENFKVFANYKVGESIKSLLVDDFNVASENDGCIGNVPHSITYPTNAPTGCSITISVPVKYQLNADKLAITALVDDIENSQETDSGSRLKIAQYTQNVQLSANYDDTVSLYTNETDIIDFLDICNINWASYSGGPSIGNSNTLTIQDESNALLQGFATYECKITPKANSDFIVGESITKQYFVNVCPWEIKLSGYQWDAPEDFDNTTLNYDKTTYLITLTNKASADNNLPFDCSFAVTGEDFYINDYTTTKVLSIPNKTTISQTATITATLQRDGEIIATITHEVVVPAEENSGTSGGTTGGGTSTYQIGDVYSENIVINNKTFSNTREIVVAANEITVSGNDGYWNSYYDSSAESFTEYHKGAFSADKGSVLIQPFAISSYEVTQDLFSAVMGFNPSYYGDSAPKGWEGDPYTTNLQRPVEYITWYDAVNFCNELTKKTLGEEYCYYNISEINKNGNNITSAKITTNSGSTGYRLPTEAEWEFAARGGDPNAEKWYYAFPGVEYKDKIDDVYYVEFESLSSYAFYDYNNEGLTSTVGEKKTNR